MDPSTFPIIALVVLAAVVVLLLLWQFSAQKENARLRAEQAGASARLDHAASIEQDRDRTRASLEHLQQVNTALQTDNGKLQTQLERDADSAQKQIQLLKESEQRLTTEFENLANRIFDEKQQKFNKESREGVENLLKPVREQLTDFRKKVEQVYVDEAKDRASLHNEIKHLKSLSERMSDDAVNLTNALKGESKVRGNWGEVLLERILEKSGLTKGREYETQASFKNEDGQRFQPDVVVHLPEKKDVVIDSKVSLVAYDRYHAAENDDERGAALREHIASIRTHITGLSAKNYDELIGINSLDLVILFVPIEPAFLLALSNDDDLLNEAFGKNILLVSPTTLMVTLQIIHNIWRYEYQNQNALVIAQQAGRMHDQFVLFAEALEDVGRQLDRAQVAYGMAHKRLVSGRGNLVGRTENLQKLGAKTKKRLPATLLEAAGDDEEQESEALDDVDTLPGSTALNEDDAAS